MKFPKVIYSADGFVHFYDNLIYLLNEIDFTILDNEGGFKMLIALSIKPKASRTIASSSSY